MRGGVLVDATAQEGIAVTFTQSGSHNDLPSVTAASTGMVANVGILIKGPDQFARPTDSRMYTTTQLLQIDPGSGYGDPVYTVTTYNVGKSTLWNPTLSSGEIVNVHRGGSYAVPSGAYVSSAAIKVPGAMVKVGATGGKWDVTSSQTDAVGMVDEFNTLNGVLIFTLWH